jgi:hypothetical protein
MCFNGYNSVSETIVCFDSTSQIPSAEEEA